MHVHEVWVHYIYNDSMAHFLSTLFLQERHVLIKNTSLSTSSCLYSNAVLLTDPNGRYEKEMKMIKLVTRTNRRYKKQMKMDSSATMDNRRYEK